MTCIDKPGPAPIGAWHLPRRTWVVLFLIGLGVRLGGAFLYGTQDMEWWKALSTYAARHGLAGIYGADDRTILDLYRRGLSYEEVVTRTQNTVLYDSHMYFRKKFIFVYPPLSYYFMTASTELNALVDPGLEDRSSRLHNFLINLFPVICSIFITYAIFNFSKSLFGSDQGVLAALLYWLNPVVILNSPIQAFLDPLMALPAVCSVVALYRRRLAWAYTFLTLAAFTKPQGVLIAPVVVWIGFREHGLAANLRGWGAAILTAVVVFSPYLLSHRMLSVLHGMNSIHFSSQNLSTESMNPWWLVQYAFNAQDAIRHNAIAPAKAILGGPGSWWSNNVPAERLSDKLGFKVQHVGLFMLLTFTVLNLINLTKRYRTCRRSIVWASVLQVYGYFMLRAGVQNNHYFLLIPLFALVCCESRESLILYACVSAVFLTQDLLFYGLGRDFNPGIALCRDSTWVGPWSSSQTRISHYSHI